MAVDGRFDHIELQDNIIYETIETRPTAQEKDLWNRLQSDLRRHKRFGVGVGLLCAVLALLNVAVPLSLYQSSLAEREQLVKELTEDQLLDRFNLYSKDDMRRRLCESDGFTFAGGLCYRISTEMRNWWNSRNWCRDRQADLMVIKSKEKQDFVERLNKTVWLGLQVKCGKFEWVDGTKLTEPKYWYPGTPNRPKKTQPNKNSTVQGLCVEFLVKGSTLDTRGWNDIGCQSANRWICERLL